MVNFFPGLSNLDFYGFLLPWIFSFAIVYGLLSKAELFGKANRQVSIALAFVIAFFVTGVGGPQLASFFVSIFGGASVFLAGILVLILFVSILGYGVSGKEASGFKHVAVLIVVVGVGIALFLGSSGYFGTRISIDKDQASLIFWLIVIIAAAYMITREKAAETEAKPDKK